MSDVAKDWHRKPQARAILSRLREAEFRRGERLGVLDDGDTYFPLTERARRYAERLDALRREAVTAQLGYNFTQAQEPYDAARTKAWCGLLISIPTVFEVLCAEFAAQAEREAA